MATSTTSKPPVATGTTSGAAVSSSWARMPPKIAATSATKSIVLAAMRMSDATRPALIRKRRPMSRHASAPVRTPKIHTTPT